MEGFRHHTSARSFAFGITTCQLAATITWGTFDEAQSQALMVAWLAQLPGPQRDTLIDISHLVVSDDGSFAAFRDLLEPLHEMRARLVRRQALVTRVNYAATMVRGYFALFPPPYELQTFDDRATALAWLGHGCCEARLEELASTRLDLLTRLRQWLDSAELAQVTIDGAAAALGVTARTLQRRLADAPTRFATELARAQVTRAQRLMRDTDRKLSDLALEVGCATPSAFSDLFRRVTGQSPSQWRRGTAARVDHQPAPGVDASARNRDA